MHEFEDLVDMSVRCLAQSKTKDSQALRSLFWNLYKFQEQWDTSFTQLRVLDILIEHKYLYRFELTEHPDYEAYKSILSNLNDFDFIHVNPEQIWHPETNPTSCFYYAPYLYCEAGSPLWLLMVESGRLQELDARSPVQIDSVELADSVIHEAEQQGDKALINMWFAALGVYLFSFYSDDQLEIIKSNPSIQDIKQIVKRTKALKSKAGYGYLKQPTRRQLREYPFMDWWYELKQ